MVDRYWIVLVHGVNYVLDTETKISLVDAMLALELHPPTRGVPSIWIGTDLYGAEIIIDLQCISSIYERTAEIRQAEIDHDKAIKGSSWTPD